MEFAIGQLVSFILGVAAGLLTPELVRRYKVFRANRSVRRHQIPALDVKNPTDNGLVEISRWSTERQFLPANLRVHVVETRPEQTWCDPIRLQEIRDGIDRPGGPTFYLVDFKIDHGSGNSGKVFEATYAKSQYRDYQAVRAYFRQYPRELEDLAHRAKAPDGVRNLVRGAPPSSIGTCVNIVTQDHKFPVIKRSAAVGENQLKWMVGVGETMDLKDFTGDRQDFFELVRVAVREEARLDLEDHSPRVISWIGLDLASAQTFVVAHVATSHVSARLRDLILDEAEGNYEQEQVEFYDLSASGVASLCARIDAEPEDWVTGSKLMLRELWRSRALI